MKTQISALDLHYLLAEMQHLKDARVDKIYNPEKEEIVIQFHVPGKGREIIRVISGKFIFLSGYKGVYEEPSGFCMFLRKYLEGLKLKEIKQVGSERIVELVFEIKDVQYKIYIELFGKGNIVVTDREDVIINALEQQKWADRSILKGERYKYPKKGFDLFKLSEKEFKEVISENNSEIVYALAKESGLGGTYAEEIIENTGIDKNKKKLSESELDKVSKEFSKLMDHEVHAEIVCHNEKIIDIVPFSLKIYKKLEKKEFPSFNEAFDAFFKEIFTSKNEFKSKHQNTIDKTKAIIAQQERQINELEKAAEEESRKGELIYEKYQIVDEVLREINKARQKHSFDEIKEKVKGHKVVKEVDAKNKKVVVEL